VLVWDAIYKKMGINDFNPHFFVFGVDGLQYNINAGLDLVIPSNNN
jgi:hypothetical protein